MALSYVTYTANGSTQQFDITFSYIEQSHIKVYVDNVEDTSFTFVNSSRIQTSSMPSNGAVVKIDRDTPTNARLVDFSDGSVLTESDLDKSANQNFFVAQETVDEVEDKLGKANDGIYDAGSTRIKNVANPTADQDAATKHYLENTWLTTANKTALTTVNDNIANINAVNTNESNINSAVSNASNINTVASNISSVNTVASDITKVVAVANDLAEAVSEVETVADDLNEATSEIDTVATNIANVNTVGGISSNVTTVAGISGNVTTVAGISSDVSTVASNNSNVTTVAGNNSNITTVAGNNSNISTVAGISGNVTTVAGISSDVTTVAGSDSNISTVAGSISNVNTTASNITDVNTFANRYRIGSADPTSSLDAGDLFFNTTSNELKHYNGSAWSVIQADTDVKTKVSANDTTAGFLNGKLVAGSNVTFTENSDGGNETLTIAATDNAVVMGIALG